MTRHDERVMPCHPMTHPRLHLSRHTTTAAALAQRLALLDPLELIHEGHLVAELGDALVQLSQLCCLLLGPRCARAHLDLVNSVVTGKESK